MCVCVCVCVLCVRPCIHVVVVEMGGGLAERAAVCVTLNQRSASESTCVSAARPDTKNPGSCSMCSLSLFLSLSLSFAISLSQPLSLHSHSASHTLSFSFHLHLSVKHSQLSLPFIRFHRLKAVTSVLFFLSRRSSWYLGLHGANPNRGKDHVLIRTRYNMCAGAQPSVSLLLLCAASR